MEDLALLVVAAITMSVIWYAALVEQRREIARLRAHVASLEASPPARPLFAPRYAGRKDHAYPVFSHHVFTPTTIVHCGS